MNNREGELHTLYRLTHLLAVGTQSSSLLRTLLREALRLTGGCGGQVLLLKADRRTLLLHLGEGEAIADDQEFPADAPPWANVIREGKVVRLKSMRAGPSHTPEDRQVTLGIPMLARGDVLGILTLRDLSEVWAKHDRAPFLEALANLAAHALHNDSLYRDLLRQKAELCTLIEVSSDITASLDLDEVFKRVVRNTDQAGGLDQEGPRPRSDRALRAEPRAAGAVLPSADEGYLWRRSNVDTTSAAGYGWQFHRRGRPQWLPAGALGPA